MYSLKQEYNNNFKEIFDNSFDYIYLHDTQGNILDINEIVVKNLGYSREEILSMKVIEFLSIVENAGEIKEAIKSTIQTGKVNKPKIYTVKRKNEEIIYLEVNTIPLKKNGKVYAILGIGHDVTNYKKVEQKLRESEKKYRHLFEQSPFSISIYDSKGILIASNHNLIHKLGDYAKEDFTGKGFIEIIKYFENSNQLIRLFSERLKSFSKGINLDPIEFPLITKGGGKIWLHWQSSKIKIGDENFIQVIIHDITDKKESEELFRILFERARDGILLADSKTMKFYTGNRMICEMLGYTVEEIKNLGVNDIHPEENLPFILEQFERSVSGDLNSTRDTPVKKKDGNIFYADINASMIEFAGRTYLMGIFRDVSEYRIDHLKLIESEKKYYTLFNNSTSGIAYHKIIYDEKEEPIDYIITDVNPQFEEILPLKKEDVINTKATDVYEVEYAPFLEVYSKVADTGKPTSFESFFPPLDKYFKISVTSQKKGEFITAFDDVTERKNAEFKIQEHSKELSVLNRIITLGNESTNFQEFLEKSYDQVLDLVGFDRGGVYLYNAETQHNLLVLNKNVHPDFVTAVKDVDISTGLFKKIFDKNKPFFIDDFSTYMENSKELGVHSAVIVPLNSKDEYVGSMNIGSPVHQVLSKNELNLLVAIGKQMGIIIQKFKSEKLLKESEEKFRALFENANDGILLADTEAWHIFTGNKKICEMLGYSLEELKNFNFEDLQPKDTLSYISGQFDHHMDEDQSSGKYIPMKRKDGSVFYCDINSSQLEIAGKQYFMGVFRDITERRKAEAELIESEEKFRTMADQSFMGIIILQDGFFKYYNQRAAEINGYSLEEINSWKANEFSKLIHPDDREFVLNQAHKKQSGEKDVVNQYQYRIVKKNGETIWVENFSKTINYKGRPADFVMTIDITEKIESEKKLKESEEKFRTIAEQSLMGIGILQDYNLKYANKRLSNLFGYTVEEMLQIDFFEFLQLIHEEDREKIAKRVDRKMDRIRDTISFYHFRAYKKTGEPFWVEVFSKIINYQGERASLLTMLDITDMKRAEIGLKESEEQFRTISEQSFMGIIIIQDGKLQYMNKAMSKIAGYPVEEMLNWTDNIMAKIVYPDDVEMILNRLKSNRDGTVSDFSHNAFRIVNREGQIRWLEDYTSKIIYKGKVANLISIVDVTDKREAEQLILEENKRLLELHELRKDLITRVSHELKTPMTSIFGAIQILLSIYRDRIDNDILNYVEIGHRGCLRLKQLIENLLDTSRLESKKLELKLEKTNLVTLVSECVDDMMYLGNLRNILMRVNLPNEVYFTLDDLRFRQVLTNIISNAIKNTPRGGKVFINLTEENDQINIIVRDTGVGLIKSEKERLFEKFGKIERYGKDLDVDIEGVGIGLHISKEITELHGGQILVESEGRNKGATFTIRLFKK